jgi:hypothetical protein
MMRRGFTLNEIIWIGVGFVAMSFGLLGARRLGVNGAEGAVIGLGAAVAIWGCFVGMLFFGDYLGRRRGGH